MITAEELNQEAQDIARAQTALETRKAALQVALHQKYFHQYAERLKERKEQHGTENIIDGKFEIKFTLGKDVYWDQNLLRVMQQEIIESKDDPKKYIDSALSIPEKRFSKWPDEIKDFFKQARVVKSKKLAITIKEKETD